MFGLARNLYKWVRRKSERVLTVVLLGVDNAGKSSVMYNLKQEVPEALSPTVGFSSEVIVMGQYQIKLYDLGGGPTFRGIWNRYYSEVYGAVFVIDSSDTRRLDSCREALKAVIENQRFENKPVLILANKQDVHGSMTPEEVASGLNVQAYQGYPIHVIGCSALARPDGTFDQSVAHGMEWMVKTVDARFKELSARVTKQVSQQKEEEQKEREAKRARVELMKRQREEERRRAEAEMDRNTNTARENSPGRELISVQSVSSNDNGLVIGASPVSPTLGSLIPTKKAFEEESVAKDALHRTLRNADVHVQE